MPRAFREILVGNRVEDTAHLSVCTIHRLMFVQVVVLALVQLLEGAERLLLGVGDNRWNIEAHRDNIGCGLELLDVLTLHREGDFKTIRLIGGLRLSEDMELRRSVRTELNRIVADPALVTGNDRKGISVRHGGHTPNAPLTYSLVGILLGGVAQHSVETFHVIVGNPRSEVTAGEGGCDGGGESHLEWDSLLAHHSMCIKGIGPDFTGDGLGLV